MSNTCSLCSSTYVWPADLKRHLKSKHGYTFTPEQQQQQPYTFTPEQQQQHPHTSTPEQQQQQHHQPHTFTPEQQQQQPHTFTPDHHHHQQQQQYSQSNEEEPYYMTQTNNPYTFYDPDKYDPNHFMPWVHPFTSVIAGPIRHMMTPIPDRIL